MTKEKLRRMEKAYFFLVVLGIILLLGGSLFLTLRPPAPPLDSPIGRVVLIALLIDLLALIWSNSSLGRIEELLEGEEKRSKT